MEIEKLGLSVRTYNAVKRYGINTTEELAERIDEFCKHAPKYGAEAREALSKVSAPQSSGVIVESAEYTRAVTLHRKICVSAELAEQNLFEMCKGLCEMRDYKLYRELGYKNFEDYCTQELKITRRQGQKYAAIASLETIDNGKSTSHFEKLGTEKLYLLSQIEETARIEIMGNTDLENTSVRELKAEIDRLKKDIKTQQDNYSMHTKRREDEIAELSKSKDKLIDDLKNAYDERDRERGYREELVDENGKMSDRISELIADNDEAQDTIRTLEHQIEELEARPVDVTIESADVKALKEAHDKDIEALNDEHKRKLEQLKDKYEKQMNEGIAKAKELAQAPDIHELWRALDNSLDNAVEAIEDFFEEHEDHPKIKDYARSLKDTVRGLNKLTNEVLAGEELS